MVRVILTYLLTFLAPTAVYLIWRSYERRRIAAGGPAPAMEWHGMPWHWLALSGAVLVVVLAAFLAFANINDPNGTYVPPRMEDGKIIPGQVIPKGEER